MDIVVELTENQVKLLSSIMRNCRFESIADAAPVFAQLAVESWIDWLSGETRYTSLTQQYADWIETIYVNLLPEDEPPSVDRLYNDFNIPFGQAQYITRVLNNKTLTHWRQKAIQQLKSAMENKLPEVDEWLANGESLLKAEITLDKLSYLELKSICDRLFRLNMGDFIPPNYQSKGGLYLVQIPAVTFRMIYEAIE